MRIHAKRDSPASATHTGRSASNRDHRKRIVSQQDSPTSATHTGPPPNRDHRERIMSQRPCHAGASSLDNRVRPARSKGANRRRSQLPAVALRSAPPNRDHRERTVSQRPCHARATRTRPRRSGRNASDGVNAAPTPQPRRRSTQFTPSSRTPTPPSANLDASNPTSSHHLPSVPSVPSVPPCWAVPPCNELHKSSSPNPLTSPLK